MFKICVSALLICTARSSFSCDIHDPTCRNYVKPYVPPPPPPPKFNLGSDNMFT